MKRAKPTLRSTLLVAATLLLGAGCAQITPEQAAENAALNLELRSMAINDAQVKRALGHRVWCVPFARTASGVDIRGNANTWWPQAAGKFDRTKSPEVGAVMAFAATRGMPMGHVAVVSDVVSEREVRVDHANWTHNQVSLGMSIKDISANNDWSSVRVESTPGAYGKPYPISGFIYPSRMQ